MEVNQKQSELEEYIISIILHPEPEDLYHLDPRIRVNRSILHFKKKKISLRQFTLIEKNILQSKKVAP
jgi:hypothetical protein